jgi:hypothetical protein
MLKFDASKARPFVREEEIAQIRPQLQLAHKMLVQKTGPGSDFLGWLELPRLYDRDEFARIRKAAAYIRKNADVLVVIGIGGSYPLWASATESIRWWFLPATILARPILRICLTCWKTIRSRSMSSLNPEPPPNLPSHFGSSGPGWKNVTVVKEPGNAFSSPPIENAAR